MKSIKRFSEGKNYIKNAILKPISAMSFFRSLQYKITRVVCKATWLRWGLRYKLFSLLPPIDFNFSVPFYGMIYSGNLNNFIDRVVYCFGAHERQVMEYMSSRIPEGGTVLDIGANVGQHSLVFSKTAGEVHAFEPNPNLHKQFDLHMKENGVANVSLHPFGVGDQTQNIRYHAPTGDNLGVGSFIGSSSSEDSGEMLPVMHGDEAMRTINPTQINFIKIDVEGYEEPVLAGLQETLKEFRPIVVIEYQHGDFSSAENFFSLIEGYTPFLLRANQPVWGIFNDPTCKLLPFDPEHAHGEVLLIPK